MKIHDGDSKDAILLSLIMRSGHILHHKRYRQSQHRILWLLYRHGNMTQRELMRFKSIKSASLSEILCKIEGRDLITREKSETDRRNVFIRITDKGMALAKEYDWEREADAKKYFSILSAAEKDQLEAILEKLTDFWEQDDE